MEVKVLCGCGAKFAFDVEPVNGQMPVAIYCPKCSADVTAFANQIISEKLGAPASAQVPRAVPVAVIPEAKPRLKASGADAVSAATPAQPVGAEANPAASVCNRHTRSAAAANCFVCQKPICLECMGQFGYLCSINCKYQAEQRGIRIPQYQFQKTVVANRWWQKVGQISAVIALLVVLLISGFIWYLYSGSQPKGFYSLKFSENKAPLHAEFLGKNELLLLFPEKLVVHDIKGKKDVWTASFTEKADTSNEEDEPSVGTFRRPRFTRWGVEPKLYLTKNLAWIALPKQVLSFDIRTGAKTQTIDLPGEMASFRATEEALFITSYSGPRKSAMTRIDLASGTAKTQETVPTPVERQMFAEEFPAGVLPTAAFLLESSLASDDEKKRALKTVYSKFISAGVNAIEMQVRMVEPKLVYVEAMKKAGPSALNATTSASTSAGLVAEEIFNDLKRSKTGGVKQVDESVYRVTLRRLLQEAEPWSGEVTGPPAVFALKTVDVLVGGKMAYVFDKQNKKLFEAKLTFPVADWLMFSAGESPFLELDKTLYFFDQGILTAFELPTGTVRWRLPSVGITKIQSDGKGHLYVNSTTASPEDIQYSEQVKIRDVISPVLLKVEAKSGKTLWRSSNLMDCELSGKYVYAMNLQIGGGIGLAQGLSDALGSYSPSSPGAEHFRIFRVDPGTGKRTWQYYHNSTPYEIDFEANRILLRLENEVRILKYMTF
ncbi:MAG: B-box zinc finger protein [Verrucomicrobia bacterium]|nr:B-box zinc finger protein [Verrucomicrobiota bacterium]